MVRFRILTVELTMWFVLPALPHGKGGLRYAHGSEALGVRTPVSRYCSHKNHLPSLPR